MYTAGVALNALGKHLQYVEHYIIILISCQNRFFQCADDTALGWKIPAETYICPVIFINKPSALPFLPHSHKLMSICLSEFKQMYAVIQVPKDNTMQVFSPQSYISSWYSFREKKTCRDFRLSRERATNLSLPFLGHCHKLMSICSCLMGPVIVWKYYACQTVSE